METIYSSDLKAHLSVDADKTVRHIRQSQEYWSSEQDVPLESANDYLREMAETLNIPSGQLDNLHKRVSFFDPREQGVEYHLSEEKHLFDSIVLGYYQTYMNVPLWRRGLSVKVKQNPNRVVGMTNNSEGDIRGELPDARTIEQFRTVFRGALARKAALDAGLGEDVGEDEAASFVRSLVGIEQPPRTAKTKRARRDDQANLLSGKFFIYKYDPDRRYGGNASPGDDKLDTGVVEEEREIPLPKLPPVADEIEPGRAYLVAEIVFTAAEGFGGLVWLILVELQTRSILYIECMTQGVNGLVFRRDPMVKTGDLTITADDGNATLNPQRDDLLLTNLDAPPTPGGTQQLRGTYVDVEELTIAHADPDIAPPTTSGGADFDYDARTDNFGAVNAYYHQTELFKTIEGLGFPIAAYFNGTTFPIPVDHRGLGNVINAHWSPNGTDGTAHMCYALCDTTNIAQPLARAVDPWVHWHEMGGHGTLGDHVGSGNLGFAHSAGDGLAALQMDPESQLRALPERFRYAPFRPFTVERRFDRGVAAWAWGSSVVTDAMGNLVSGDDGQYGSEQILATCHFRIYRSIGGDHADLGRRQFASRVMTYLILRTIDNLTSGTNPSNWDPVAMATVPGRGAQLWSEEMQDTDLENWTSEGLSGGAYNKVIRWAFEKQGSYQSPGTPAPFTTEGAPPAVDVYIDDGRAGEYHFQAVHWHNISMWNRQSADGLTAHQNAVDGQTNYMYGKVKNRGTAVANNVTVRAFHSLPGAGLTWPTDFVEMNPVGGLPIASIVANSSAEITVGPFEWEPNINVYGHDCVLMIASVAGDPSNIDNFTGSETIQEWRLVPNDNNVGQRNVSVVPGGGGSEALTASLNGAPFIAGNNLNRRAVMELNVEMPPILAEKGWQLQFDGVPERRFLLKAGEKRKIRLMLVEGAEFTKADVETAADRMITVSLRANGILLGGMSYALDPELREPSGGRPARTKKCEDAAQRLVECLELGGAKVKRVRVKQVSLDLHLDDDCACD